MTILFSPLQLLSVALASWMNRHQQVLINYLLTENQLSKEQLERRRLRLTDQQRRRLAVKAKALGREGLRELGTLFTADTHLGWHGKLIVEKWCRSCLLDRSLRRMLFVGRTHAANRVYR